MRNTGKAALAVLAGLMAAPAAFASGFDIEFSGYLRAGTGGSSEGGDQICFQAPGASAKYRLGNECEVYSEIGLGGTVFKGQDGSYFKLGTRVAYVVEGESDFEQTRPAFREAYALGGNLFGGFLKDAKFWAGKRFYKREDVHMNDFYYWDASGVGGGIEDVNLGFGKLSYAYFRNSNDQVNEFRVGLTDENGNPLLDANGRRLVRTITGDVVQVNDRAISRHDVRLSDIAVNQDGLLTIGAEARFAEESRNNFDGKNGYAFHLQHFQNNVWGGFNKIAVQYGVGSASSLASWSDDTRDSDRQTFRIVEQLVIQPSANWSGQLAAIWEHQKDTQDWYSFGVRPIYHFTDHLSLAFEAGYDRVNPKNGEDRELWKFTIAPQLTPGRGYWSRPALRLFATYATWNDGARDAGLRGSNGDTNDFTFGLQVEAWW